MSTPANGAAQAFALCGPRRDEGVGPKTGEVYSIYLHPEAWGQGHGRALLQHTLRDLRERGFNGVRIWTLEANEQAAGFYTAAGFKLTGDESFWRPDDINLPKICFARELEVIVKKKQH